MSSMEISFVVWGVEAVIIFGIIWFMFRHLKIDHAQFVTFIFVTLLWMSLKVVDDYKYRAMGQVSGNDLKYAILATLAYGGTILLVRYPMTWFGTKWHKKVMMTMLAAGATAIMSILTTVALVTENQHLTEVALVLSSASLGIVYSTFTTTSSLMANQTQTKNAFISVLIIVMAMFAADALVTPIKTLTIGLYVSDGNGGYNWTGYSLMWMMSAVFAVLTIFVGVFTWKYEKHPDYQSYVDTMEKKASALVPKGQKDEFKMHFGVKNVPMRKIETLWWHRIIILSIVGFIVVSLNSLMSSEHFGSSVMNEMFNHQSEIGEPYSDMIQIQITAFLASINSLFILGGVSMSAYYFIPRLGFRNTIKLGLFLIAIYAAIATLNAYDPHLRSPILMFLTYGLLGAGFGMTYYTMIGYVILLEVSSPYKKKFSVLGLWLTLIAPAIIISEIIFVTVIGTTEIDFNSLSIVMFVSIIISIIAMVLISYLEKDVHEGALFNQACPVWARKSEYNF